MRNSVDLKDRYLSTYGPTVDCARENTDQAQGERNWVQAGLSLAKTWTFVDISRVTCAALKAPMNKVTLV